MSAKSIIQVEVDDSAWKAFNKSVEDHQKNLAKMPSQWGAVGKSIQRGVDASAKFTAGIKNAAKQFKDASTMSGKLTLSLKAADRLTTSLARGTLTIARNLKDATKSLLSWGSVMGLISGVLGAGGLFGISRMAQNVSGNQTSAQRAGSTYGGALAAKNAYGNIVDVQRLMEQIQMSQASGGVMFRRLENTGGMKRSDWEGKDPSDVVGPLIRALKESFLRMAPKPGMTDTRALSMSTYAPEGIDLSTLKQISMQNVDALQSMYESNKRQLALSERTQAAWTTFIKRMDASGDKIENVFASSLVGLSGPLNDFADSLVKATKIIMGSDLVRNLIKGAGRVVESGAKYLASQQFETDMKSFIAELQDIGSSMMTVVGYLESWFGKTPEQSAAESSKKLRNGSNIGSFAPGEGQRLINQIPGNTTVNVNIDGDLIASKRQKAGNMSENTFSQAYSAASGNYFK